MTQISPQRIGQIEARFAELEARMASGTLEGDAFVTASKEYAELEPVASAAREVRRLRAEMETLDAMAKDPSADAELRDMAVEELLQVAHDKQLAEHDLAILLLPKDVADERSAMLEIRAGTGGDEAALFAGDLFRMYERYAASQGWKVEAISMSASDVGGFKEVVASVSGAGDGFQLGIFFRRRDKGIALQRPRSHPRLKLSQSRFNLRNALGGYLGHF